MLPAGNYIIRNVGTNLSAGRQEAEDKSLNIKQVVLLPQGVEAPVFEFRTEGQGTIICARGAPTIVQDRLLYAALTDEQPQVWKVEAVPQHGENVYIIVKLEDSWEGWVAAEDEPYTQIAVRPLIATKSFPPQYPPNQLWQVVPDPRNS